MNSVPLTDWLADAGLRNMPLEEIVKERQVWLTFQQVFAYISVRLARIAPAFFVCLSRASFVARGVDIDRSTSRTLVAQLIAGRFVRRING